MNYLSERNERRARKQALVLAIGLHLSLGGLLYYQMSDSKTQKQLTPDKTELTKAAKTMAAEVVNRP